VTIFKKIWFSKTEGLVWALIKNFKKTSSSPDSFSLFGHCATRWRYLVQLKGNLIEEWGPLNRQTMIAIYLC
jgi:hypothetical protein